MNIEKLFPVYKNYIWGGDKLSREYGKSRDVSPLAESWELSFHKDGISKLSSGEELSSVLSNKDIGTNAASFLEFPTLIKFIDAKENLSVQVHPSDEYALLNENSYGKTEMWYIVSCDEGAGIYLGLKRDVSCDELDAAIKEERLTELLNFYSVREGECYFIPSGTLHAIGKGCVILEIQQNSNLTYRVYDYGRLGADGKPRELHVEKAKAVSNLKKFTPAKPPSDILGLSKYFTARKYSVNGDLILFSDKGSFRSVTCTGGSGYIEEKPISQGDSFFVPADFGEFKLTGEMEIVMTEIRKYYIGIDLGGTFIKGGIVDDLGRIIVSSKVPTEKEKGDISVVDNIAKLCDILLSEANMVKSDIVGIGLGVPGMIDTEKGTVVYANNLNWKDFKISKTLEAKFGLPVKIGNDANVAALGETLFGSGKNYKTTVMITLGTGVGGGIVIDGKLFEGNKSAGAELGHSVILAGGEPCTCGMRGCLEAYASATALIRDTKRKMLEDKSSKMWEIGSIDAVTGKTAFDYADKDASAKAVVDRYIEMLGIGIVNIANVFRPEAVILGGGVCAQGETLLNPLTEYVNKYIYAGTMGPKVEIIIATLENSAGLLGAAALWM